MKNKSFLLRVFLIVFILICVGVGYLVVESYREDNTITRIFSIEDKNIVYKISYDKQFGAYNISPYHYKGGGSASYISTSSVPLKQFIGKEVKITGKFVLTKTVLTYKG